MMGDVSKFKERLQNYDGRTIPDDVIKQFEPIVGEADFNPEFMRRRVRQPRTCAFRAQYLPVQPEWRYVELLMRKLEAAQKSKAEALASLKEVQDLVAEIEAKLAKLVADFQKATDEKQAVEAKAAACNERLGLAGRLIGGLASENELGVEIEHLKEQGRWLTGDVMLAAAFVSYVGSFGAKMRRDLWHDTWMEDLRNRGILSDDAEPLQQLTNEANNAKMMSEGLPSDKVSIENGLSR